MRTTEEGRLRAFEATANSETEALLYYPSGRRVELRPTLGCNQRCGFCNSVAHGTAQNVVGLSGISKALDAFDGADIRTVAITGGEPTLIPDLPAIVADVTRRGYKVELQTNGMALGEGDLASRLRTAGVSEVLVSLHAADPTLSDEEITKVEGAHARTVAGIDAALAAGMDVALSHVIHQANYTHLSAFVDLVADSWGDRTPIRLAYVAPTGGAHTAVDTFVPPLREALSYVRAALAVAVERQVPLIFLRTCGIPPCLLRPFEALSETLFRPEAHFPDRHTKLDACATCIYERACPGFWKRYLDAHGPPEVEPFTTPISRADLARAALYPALYGLHPLRAAIEESHHAVWLPGEAALLEPPRLPLSWRHAHRLMGLRVEFVEAERDQIATAIDLQKDHVFVLSPGSPRDGHVLSAIWRQLGLPPIALANRVFRPWAVDLLPFDRMAAGDGVIAYCMANGYPLLLCLPRAESTDLTIEPILDALAATVEARIADARDRRGRCSRPVKLIPTRLERKSVFGRTYKATFGRQLDLGMWLVGDEAARRGQLAAEVLSWFQ